jgi:hypothetical protein
VENLINVHPDRLIKSHFLESDQSDRDEKWNITFGGILISYIYSSDFRELIYLILDEKGLKISLGVLEGNTVFKIKEWPLSDEKEKIILALFGFKQMDLFDRIKAKLKEDVKGDAIKDLRRYVAKGKRHIFVDENGKTKKEYGERKNVSADGKVIAYIDGEDEYYGKGLYLVIKASGFFVVMGTWSKICTCLDTCACPSKFKKGKEISIPLQFNEEVLSFFEFPKEIVAMLQI